MYACGLPGLPPTVRSSSTRYSPPTAIIGKPAPSFKDAGAVVDNEITTVSLDQYKGSWVVLLFYPKGECVLLARPASPSCIRHA
jgi:peroxiredoxin